MDYIMIFAPQWKQNSTNGICLQIRQQYQIIFLY
jgi:hypothetical protein